MALTPDGLARMQRCCSDPCPYVVFSPGKGAEIDSRFHSFCAADGEGGRLPESGWRHLDPAVWDDAAAVCPMGYWDGLAPLTIDTDAASRQTQVAQYGPVVELLTQGDDDKARAEKLSLLVEAGLLGQPAADAIASELTAPDAPAAEVAQ